MRQFSKTISPEKPAKGSFCIILFFLTDEKIVFCKLSPMQVAIYEEILKQPKVKMLIGVDKNCTCGSNIIARKCCKKVWSCNFFCKVENVKNCAIVLVGLHLTLQCVIFRQFFFSWIFFPLKLTCMWIKSSKSGNITEILNMLMHGNSNRVLSYLLAGNLKFISKFQNFKSKFP